MYEATAVAVSGSVDAMYALIGVALIGVAIGILVLAKLKRNANLSLLVAAISAAGVISSVIMLRETDLPIETYTLWSAVAGMSTLPALLAIFVSWQILHDPPREGKSEREWYE